MQQEHHHRQSGLLKMVLSKPVETEKIHPDTANGACVKTAVLWDLCFQGKSNRVSTDDVLAPNYFCTGAPNYFCTAAPPLQGYGSCDVASSPYHRLQCVICLIRFSRTSHAWWNRCNFRRKKANASRTFCTTRGVVGWESAGTATGVPHLFQVLL